jgi:hypothetical protein
MDVIYDLAVLVGKYVDIVDLDLIEWMLVKPCLIGLYAEKTHPYWVG